MPFDLKKLNVFKVNAYPYSSSRFVAVKTLDELYVYCARLVHGGVHITSVNQMLEFSPRTPRIAVMNEKMFKDELKRLTKEDKGESE